MSASSWSDPRLDLVERAAEMKRLDADLDSLHHGGEALVFRGEPGIGKLALLKQHTLIHPSVPWLLPGHPEVMKMDRY
jgi:hypothetical protein